jgi:opacity protein-like surface antigen
MKLRMLAILLFILVTAMPAVSAEMRGIYGGLKFLDALQSTGELARGGALNGINNGAYVQNTVGGGAFLGYDFDPELNVPVRTDIEYAIRTNSTSSWHTSGYDFKGTWNVQTLLANVYFDVHNSTPFTPYVGGGLGVAFLTHRYEFSNSSHSNTKWGQNALFAWNAGVGGAYKITENVSADLAYRFLGLQYSEKKYHVNGDKMKIGMAPYANEFSLGLRFTF